MTEAFIIRKMIIVFAKKKEKKNENSEVCTQVVVPCMRVHAGTSGGIYTLFEQLRPSVSDLLPISHCGNVRPSILPLCWLLPLFFERATQRKRGAFSFACNPNGKGGLLFCARPKGKGGAFSCARPKGKGAGSSASSEH